MLLISTMGFYSMGKGLRGRLNQEKEDRSIPEALCQGLALDDSEPAVPCSGEASLLMALELLRTDNLRTRGRWCSCNGGPKVDLTILLPWDEEENS